MKYKLFVSANQTELRDERLAIKDVITANATLRGFFDVFLFEDLPAKEKSAAATYLRHVTNSDVYVCILGQKYGDKGKDDLSATEREFRAFRKAKPGGEIMAFIKGASAEDKRRDPGMQDFLKEVKASFIYKRFQNADALKTQVLNSLISFLDDKGEYSKGPFDKTVRKDLGYDAIDEKLVKDFLQNRAIKLKVAVPKGSIKKFLVDAVKIVKKEGARFYPTNTAILFFGQDPTGHISHHEIRIARFQGTSRVSMIDSKEIKGPVYSMLEEAETFFKRNTRLANKIVEFKRVDIPEYPFEAVREAIVNAIAHRDYTRTGSPLMVAIFDDRVEVRNHGGLLPQMNIKKLEGNHATRNEAICAIFHETMDMERFGTGIGKMKKLMKEHGLAAPEFSEEGDFFVVKFYGPGEKILGLVPSIPEERQTDLKKLGLNERQIDALRLMVNEKKVFSNQAYRAHFKVSNQTFVRDMKLMVEIGQVRAAGKGRSLRFSAE
ncbi:MAG: ATP-binding protein [Candidatus Omnitrophota bacterium]